MRTHSRSFKQRKCDSNKRRTARQARRGRSSRPRKPQAAITAASTPAPTADGAGFLAAWRELLGAILLPSVPKRRGRKPRVLLASLLAALVFHVMNPSGTLSEHFEMLYEDALNDSAC